VPFWLGLHPLHSKPGFVMCRSVALGRAKALHIGTHSVPPTENERPFVRISPQRQLQQVACDKSYASGPLCNVTLNLKSDTLIFLQNLDLGS
jgi:hypothetical protein